MSSIFLRLYRTLGGHYFDPLYHIFDSKDRRLLVNQSPGHLVAMILRHSVRPKSVDCYDKPPAS
jgi:hypothetical protein